MLQITNLLLALYQRSIGSGFFAAQASYNNIYSLYAMIRETIWETLWRHINHMKGSSILDSKGHKLNMNDKEIHIFW